MPAITPDTLVTGTDRWFVEKFVNEDFFWYSNPFENSKSKGFIIPGKHFILKIPTLIIVDISESPETDFLSFNIERTVFYSEIWNSSASTVASFIKNIYFFNNGKFDIVKKNYKITI